MRVRDQPKGRTVKRTKKGPGNLPSQLEVVVREVGRIICVGGGGVRTLLALEEARCACDAMCRNSSLKHILNIIKQKQ